MKITRWPSHVTTPRRSPARDSYTTSEDAAVNAAWMWGALLAVTLSAWLQELAGLDHGDGRGRAHLPRLRRELICLPARVVQHARATTLRLPPGPQILPAVLARLRALPHPA